MAGKKGGVPRGEDSLLSKIKDASSLPTGLRPSLTLGIGDDAALYVPRPGHQSILTCDWFLEGPHFLLDKHPADAVGWKSLARALSDIAAMGGLPRCALLALALPLSHTGRWLDEFLQGWRRAARKFKCPLAGGDTTQRRQILINVMVVGEVRKGQGILRSGARPGDLVFVSGRLGQAELGLRRLRGKGRASDKDSAVRKHLYPQPRIALGLWLSVQRIPTAMMDLSDGLSSDLPRLCAASRVGARIYAATLPVVSIASPSGKSQKSTVEDPVDLALNGGEDYELLFTASPNKVRRLPRSFQGIPLTKIGEITRELTVNVIGPDGHEEPLEPRGWDPFVK